MKRYLNKHEFFLDELKPEKCFAELNKSQKDFKKFLAKLKLIEEGEVSSSEEAMIQKIKDEIHQIKKKNQNTDPAKFDFELGKIFHQRLKIERAKLNDWGFWRWLSLNYFLEEIQWRWAKKLRDKGEIRAAANPIYDHLIGKNKNHRIFPRRLYIIGLRLHDGTYDLVDKISNNLKNNVQAGYGDFINNIADTKLISPDDNVSKIMGKILLSSSNTGNKDTVVKSFKKYNGYKNRLLSNAPETVFKKEICIV